MKRIVLLILLVLSVSVLLFAQEGKYERKSISSVESVWIKPGALNKINQFDYNLFDKMVKHYIQLERFDYNILPQNVTADFRTQANASGNISPEALAEIMNKTVGVKIKEILEDPAVQQMRGKDLKDQSWGATFAGSKGKSMGLTVEELARLMNSAYVYLPYISSMKQEEKEGKITVTINGGIIWYQVKVEPDGKVNMVLRVAQSTMAMGFSDRNPKQVMGIKADYSHFDFGKESFPTTVEQYAQYDAVQAWTKNLGVKTKEIAEFNLSAQVADSRGGAKFGFALGKKEGIHLDDTFFIVENYEDKDGKVKSKQVGFARVSKTADNTNNAMELSEGVLYYGSASQGSVMQEHPRLGIDIALKMGSQSGMDIPKETGIYKDDVTGQFLISLIASYNLAPIIGSSQTFLDMEGDFGIPYGDAADGNDELSASTASAYIGLSKKFWFHRNALALSGMLGYDRFVIDWYGDTFGFGADDYTLSVNAFGAKFGADYNMLLTPDLRVSLGADYKLGFAPTGITLENSSETLLDDPASDIDGPYGKIRMGGMTIRAGVSYSFGELPINLFGFLDPLKKY
jgi:hypothetical protein